MKKLFMIIIFMMLSSIGFPKEGFVPSQNNTGLWDEVLMQMEEK